MNVNADQGADLDVPDELVNIYFKKARFSLGNVPQRNEARVKDAALDLRIPGDSPSFRNERITPLFNYNNSSEKSFYNGSESPCGVF